MAEDLPPPRGRGFRLRGFADAWHGLKILVLTQPNARIHLVAAAGVVAAGCWCRLGAGEWAQLVLAITGVWVSEALNTAIEFTVDLVTMEQRRLAGWAKDVAAGATLVAAAGAVVIGLLTFGPHLTAWYRGR